MSRRVVLVGCGSSKRQDRQPAYAMYDSTYFAKKWVAAMYLGDPYIISAKHGLLPPEKRIEPYDETLHDYSVAERREWGDDVVGDLPDNTDEVVLLAGSVYRQPICDIIETQRPHILVHDLFKDTSGMGEQVSLCQDIVSFYRGGNGGDLL